MPYNFTNPTVGPTLKQLYFRQAVQALVNQPEYVKDFNGGLASVGNGPAPTYPVHNVDESPLERSANLFPYDPSRAVRLLKDHGWNVVPRGISYCSRPGNRLRDVRRGNQAGSEVGVQPPLTPPVTWRRRMKCRRSLPLKGNAGIQITLSQGSFNDVLGVVFGGIHLRCTVQRLGDRQLVRRLDLCSWILPTARRTLPPGRVAYVRRLLST